MQDSDDLTRRLLENPPSIFKALETVAPFVPTPFYWMDANGVVLGINEQALKAIGATSEIIGKKPYSFYKKEIAEHILKHNAEVVKTGQILSQEEWTEDVTTKAVKCFSSIKSPLYDNEGNIVGIIGSSLEITAEKEAERLKEQLIQQEIESLKRENELHKKMLQEQERFTQIVSQVAHDITSPTTTLSILVEVTAEELPEEIRVLLKSTATRINDIARNLLAEYRTTAYAEPSANEQAQELLLSSALWQILAEKKLQYANLPIQFDYQSHHKFAFIQMQPAAFKRMLSNLINNAVDALDKHAGNITLTVNIEHGKVHLILKDTGKGMPETVIQKILNRESVTAGKAEGHGIGMTQVWDTLTHNHGTMNIESKPGEGTTITLTFPHIKAPNWIADKIELNSNTTVWILDDDQAIHGAWDKRFHKDAPNIPLKHYTHGQDLLNDAEQLSPETKANILLLTDYELLKQEYNGLEIIEKTGLKNAILVTSHDENEKIRMEAAKMNTKILPKLLASEIQIAIGEH